MDSKISRRDFLKYVGLTTGVAMFPEQAFAQDAPVEKSQPEKDAAKTIYEAGDHRGRGIPPLEYMLRPDVYRKMTKDLKWDPVYGPEVDANPYYGGRADFNGHQKHAGHDGGTDYPLPLGFPLVPIFEGYVDVGRNYENYPGGTRLCLFFVTEYFMGYEYAHLSSRIVKAPASEKDAIPRRHKFVGMRDIVARSGDTGRTMSPHLHIGVYTVQRWDTSNSGYFPLDFEKMNRPIVPTNDGRPFFWDGKTHLWLFEKKRPEQQFGLLEEFVRKDIDKLLLRWGKSTHDNAELAGKVLEYKRLIGNQMSGKDILESIHFHNLRKDLAKKVLEDRLFSPADGAYSAMLAAHSYGREPKNRTMVCLPLLSPDIVHKARVATWEGGIKKIQYVDEYIIDDNPNLKFTKQEFWDKIRQELGIEISE